MKAQSKLRLPKSDPVLRVMPMPADANVHGDVFGGWIMAQVDVAGAIPAARRANSPLVEWTDQLTVMLANGTTFPYGPFSPDRRRTLTFADAPASLVALAQLYGVEDLLAP